MLESPEALWCFDVWSDKHDVVVRLNRSRLVNAAEAVCSGTDRLLLVQATLERRLASASTPPPPPPPLSSISSSALSHGLGHMSLDGMAGGSSNSAPLYTLPAPGQRGGDALAILGPLSMESRSDAAVQPAIRAAIPGCEAISVSNIGRGCDGEEPWMHGGFGVGCHLT
jgi:hypothetical protein